MRDDFTEEVKRTLAARVGNHCSNPGCRALTSGPQVDPGKALNVGVAAHITAAAPAGPRYNPLLLSQERCHADNGIWLCQTCAKLVDNDPSQFPAHVLRAWKAIARTQRTLHNREDRIVSSDKQRSRSNPFSACKASPIVAETYGCMG